MGGKMNWKLLAVALPLSCCLCSAMALAEPSVKKGNTAITITDGINADVENQLKGETTYTRFVLSHAADADLAKLCALFPGMTTLRIEDAKSITDLTPLAALNKLKRLDLDGCEASDLTPLAGLVGLESLDVKCPTADVAWMEKLTNLMSVKISSEKLTSLKGLPKLQRIRKLEIYSATPDDLTPIAEAMPGLKELKLNSVTIPDLTPLTRLAMLEDLDLYGATVKDFSPLAACPRLKKLNYYATKGADYSTLGKLTRLQELKGGLTELSDIAWIANLPGLKKFTLFAEAVTDYAPLAKTRLEYLKIWSMKAPVDLVPVGKITTLKELVFWSVEEVSGSKALAGLTELKKLTVNGFNKKDGGEHFDLSAASGWKKLKELSMQETEVDNFAALAACTSLENISLIKMNVPDLTPLKQLPALKSVRVSKDFVTDAELQGFGPKVKVRR